MHPHSTLRRRLLAIVCLLMLPLGVITEASARPDPVTLIYFRVVPGPNQLTVEWETAAELDTVAFTLYRSVVSAPADWGEPIYTVPASGNAIEGATYSYIDMAVNLGVKYYYLLRELDTGGVVTDLATASGGISLGCDAVSEIPRAECEALVKLYETTDGPGWAQQNGWLANNSPCTWYGVTCRLGHVRAISLGCNSVGGLIPSELRNLTRLEVLDLAGGMVVFHESGVAQLVECAGPHLHGSIPKDLGSLAYLQQLNLAVNAVSYGIPPELGKLTYLQQLSLSGNPLSGSIPAVLGKLVNLQRLDLIENRLSGPIPPQFGDLASLQRLDLRGNQLSGSIPPQLGNLANLHWLDLSYNQLTGPIPPEIGKPALLYRLDLSSNQLSGLIPPALGAPLDLQWLHLRDNQLSGALPRSLMNLDLSGFDYDHNSLCEPPDAGFQAWLASIENLGRTGVVCKQTYVPLILAQPSADDSFWADSYFLEPGGCTTLHWKVSNVQSVYLNGQPVTGVGDRMVCPSNTTVYTLTVISGDGSVHERYVTITVADSNPWVGIDEHGNFYRSNPNASVRLEEFMDFQCPFCARHALQTGPLLNNAYVATGEVVEVFHVFPLNIHLNAVPAAKAAYCAGLQTPELFWAMYDWLFQNQAAWSEDPKAADRFRSTASLAGADVLQYDACIAGAAPDAHVRRDTQEGTARAVRGTPAFFINDWVIPGAVPFEVFRDTIEKAKLGLRPTVTPTVTQRPAVTPAPASHSGFARCEPARSGCSPQHRRILACADNPLGF